MCERRSKCVALAPSHTAQRGFVISCIAHMIIARNPLITIDEPKPGDQATRPIRSTSIWTDKERISAVKSRT
jgi:hypothetical protein